MAAIGEQTTEQAIPRLKELLSRMDKQLYASK
jgi:hypothetical protein